MHLTRFVFIDNDVEQINLKITSLKNVKHLTFSDFSHWICLK